MSVLLRRNLCITAGCATTRFLKLKTKVASCINSCI